jgi:hypothetical protein
MGRTLKDKQAMVAEIKATLSEAQLILVKFVVLNSTICAIALVRQPGSNKGLIALCKNVIS